MSFDEQKIFTDILEQWQHREEGTNIINYICRDKNGYIYPFLPKLVRERLLAENFEIQSVLGRCTRCHTCVLYGCYCPEETPWTEDYITISEKLN